MKTCVGLKTLEINVLEDLSIFGGLDYEALHLEVILATLVDDLEATFG